jgi:hypothetical protein
MQTSPVAERHCAGREKQSVYLWAELADGEEQEGGQPPGYEQQVQQLPDNSGAEQEEDKGQEYGLAWQGPAELSILFPPLHHKYARRPKQLRAAVEKRRGCTMGLNLRRKATVLRKQTGWRRLFLA